MNKKNYTLRESALTYIFVLLALFCASLLVMNLVSTVAQSTGQDINVVVNENWVKYINIASAPIALFFVYLVFNFGFLGMTHSSKIIIQALKICLDMFYTIPHISSNCNISIKCHF